MTTAALDNGGLPVVVIADDDPDIRMLVELAVRKAGAVIGASVEDGAAALDAIRRLKPDLVVLDVSMPRLTGVQVCELVRSEPDIARTTVILLSAAVQASAVRAGQQAGAEIYLPKPFSPRQLAARIAELLTAVRV